MQQNPPFRQIVALSAEDIPPAARAAQFISRLTMALVILLAVASFTLSFESLSQLAAQSGAVPPARAWVFAVLIDGAIVIFSISALRASIARQCVKWPMSLVIITTMASIVLNMAHTRGGVVAWLVAAMPPLLLFLSFESLMKQLAGSLRPACATRKRPRTKTAGVSTPVAASGNATAAARQERHERAVALLRSGRPKRAVAREAGLALSTVRRLAFNLNTQPAAA